MVDSVVLVVFKSTAVWLFNKGRERALKKLRNSGDVVDQTLCNLIAGDLDEIKSELKAARRTDLLASIDLYNEGLRSISFDAKIPVEPPQKRMKLDDGPLQTFYKANVDLSVTTKKRFADARLAAGRALGNTKLEIKDSILAYYIKVMATLLEDADADPARAILFCKGYLEKMNSMETVSKYFNKEFGAGSSPYSRAASNSSERRDIIWCICHVNRIVFDIAQLVGGDSVFRELFIWPCIKIGKNETEEIDPLRDPRLNKTLTLEGKEHCSVMRSFGQEGDNSNHKLTLPCSVASNPQGQYLVVDDITTDVFNRHGRYVSSLPVPTNSHAVDVATDENGNAYLLVTKVKQDHERVNTEQNYEVFVLDNDGKKHHSFPLRDNSKGRKLAVNHHSDKTEVLVLEGERKKGLHAMVEVYETDGTFVCQFGERILQDAQDIVSANKGHIFVLDKCHESEKKFIREFGADRRQLRRYGVASDSVAIAFHRASEDIVIISTSNPKDFELSIHQATDGSHDDRVLQVLRKYKFDINGVLLELHATVTTKGRIAIVIAKNSNRGEPQGRVIIC